MVNEGLRIFAVLTSRLSYHILLAFNIADGNENVLHDGHLRMHVVLTFYNRESILIGVDGLRLLHCHDVISIYILLEISNQDVGMTGPIINSLVVRMESLLSCFGVRAEERSPFHHQICWRFT